MYQFTVQDLPLSAASMASMILDRKPDRSKLCTPRIVRPLGEQTASLSCERYKCLNSKKKFANQLLLQDACQSPEPSWLSPVRNHNNKMTKAYRVQYTV